MESVAEFLQTNPIITILTFVLSVGGAVITVAARRRELWGDFLAKKITLPVYVYLILVLALLFVAMLWPGARDRPRRLRTVDGAEFGVQRVIMDGKHFRNCRFRNTELVFRGEADCTMENCNIETRHFTFDGPAAMTAKILTAMYKVPQLRPLIDSTFEAIKKGELPRAVPPSSAADD